jgi:4-carboxymuconolactone decarboxylase
VARIPLIDGTSLDPEQQRVYDAVVAGPRGKVQGPLRAALHSPELADKWQQLGEFLRYRTNLPPRLSEIAILVTAQRMACDLEWHLHAEAAAKAGLEPAIIEALRGGRRPDASDDDLEIHDFAAQLHDAGIVSNETYEMVRARWGVVGVVELTALVGYYTMVAMTLNNHGFPLPEGVAPPFDLPRGKASE